MTALDSENLKRVDHGNDRVAADRSICHESTVNGPISMSGRTKWWTSQIWVAVQFVREAVAGLFGFFAIVLVMSIVATVPVAQLLSLGYLLEAGARVARSGRLRDGFVGIDRFRRVAGVCVAMYLLFVPVRVLADIRNSAALLHTNPTQMRLLTLGTFGLTTLFVGHVAWAIYRGGRIRSFLWPRPLGLVKELRQNGIGGMYCGVRDRTWDFCVALRLPYFFWLGLRGFAVAIVWLAVPVSILVVASRLPSNVAPLLSIIGGVLLLGVLFYLPFLQLNFARSRQFRRGLQWRCVRQQFCRAPIAFAVALAATLVLAIPLYLLKAELIPREAAWLPSLVFVVSILPTRILTGWAIWRADRRDEVRLWVSRWASRLLVLPLVAAYVLIIFLTQYTSWYGVWSLYEQHAFLLPVPFIGM